MAKAPPATALAAFSNSGSPKPPASMAPRPPQQAQQPSTPKPPQQQASDSGGVAPSAANAAAGATTRTAVAVTPAVPTLAGATPVDPPLDRLPADWVSPGLPTTIRGRSPYTCGPANGPRRRLGLLAAPTGTGLLRWPPWSMGWAVGRPSTGALWPAISLARRWLGLASIGGQFSDHVAPAASPI